MELLDKNGLTEAQYIENYRKKNYAKPALTADICIFGCSGKKLSLLLIFRGGHPFIGALALPGGFADCNEPTSDTAARELLEETGVSGIPLIPVGLYSEPGRDSRGWVVSMAYTAVIDRSSVKVAAGDDAAGAEWFDIEAGSGKIILTNGKNTVSVEYDERTNTLPLGKSCVSHPVDRTAGNTQLAFDHSQIIIDAMSAAGLL